MLKEEDSESCPLKSAEKNVKAEANFRGLLTPYSYCSPTPSGPQLPRRSPRNLSKNITSELPGSTVKAEPDSVTLTLTPTPLVKKRLTSSSTQKRKREAEADDDCLPLPPSLHELSVASAKSSKKQKRGYAPPETYAHIKGLPDHLANELDVLFCGINPGYKSAESGAHYAHPANHFWRCLHQGGFTPTRLPPSDGYLLPEKYNVGLTNIVERPSAEAGELSKAEIGASVRALLDKLQQFRPRIVCFVGKLIWDAVTPVLAKHAIGKPLPAPQKRKGAKASGPFVYDYLQPYKLVHVGSSVPETLFFVVPSSSGRVVSHQLNDKIVLFSKLKAIVEDLKSGACDTSTFLTVSASLFQPPGGPVE